MKGAFLHDDIQWAENERPAKRRALISGIAVKFAFSTYLVSPIGLRAGSNDCHPPFCQAAVRFRRFTADSFSRPSSRARSASATLAETSVPPRRTPSA